MARDWRSQLTGADRDAASALISMFEQYDLGSLASTIVRYLKQDWGDDAIYSALQETREWKQRFRGNELRQKAGLPVLPPSEYIATERAYRQALQASGMPRGMWDKQNDFHEFIAKDISPTEIAERATFAKEAALSVDGEQRKALARRYGIGVGDLAAYFLNPSKALPELQKKYDVAMLEAERTRAGFNSRSASASALYSAGITPEQAREGYSAIARARPDLNRLANLKGASEGVGLVDLEHEAFLGGKRGAQSARKQGRLRSQERARFSGSGGTSGATYGRDRTFD